MKLDSGDSSKSFPRIRWSPQWGLVQHTKWSDACMLVVGAAGRNFHVEMGGRVWAGDVHIT